MNEKIVALVGRPNVGKSTLFNRLSIKKKAIVHDKPGVTRDRKYAQAQLGPLEFMIVDTPGLEESAEGKLEHRMMNQTIEAIKESDLVCLIVDGREGVTPVDKFFAKLIRKYTSNILLVVNKCEQKFDFSSDYYKLGFDKPVIISAEHAIGMMGMYEAISESISSPAENDFIAQDPISADYIQIVVAGRPNAGKSTFINSMIGAERLLTGPEAGITRESIEIDWQHNDKKIKIIDTAGLRRRSSVKENLEKLSTSDTINSINFANTVILMIDAQNPLEQQDLNIANYTIDQGRGLVIVVNKWDLVENKAKFKDEFHFKLESHLPQVKGISVVFISALKKQGINQVLDACARVYDIWNKKVSTSKLNEWIRFATEAHPLPLQKGGRRVRIKYVTQIKARPPTFKLFTNNPDKITDSYERYLVNSLRESFDMPGILIRFIFDKTKNPYVK